jgi:hypothetical protein
MASTYFYRLHHFRLNWQLSIHNRGIAAQLGRIRQQDHLNFPAR